MHPELFRIGPLAIQSYGVMLALSFIVGIYVAVYLGEKKGLKGDDIVNISFISIISSIIGSRLFYVVFHVEEFQGRWVYIFWPVQENGTIGIGGLILLGGFLLAFFSSLVYIYRKKLNFWKLADSIAPAIALGIFLTRIGCFLNGCCFGKVCDLPWGIKFPFNSPAGSVMGEIHVHPTQLYSSLYGILIFIVLIFLNRYKLFDGVLIGTFFVLYGISRFFIDFYRFYERQMFILDGLQFNQLVSLMMLVTGLSILFYRYQIKKMSQGL
jgi:phosphatidylglycerol:prolipoprotein diacylglycerol transferase